MPAVRWCDPGSATSPQTMRSGTNCCVPMTSGCCRSDRTCPRRCGGWSVAFVTICCIHCVRRHCWPWNRRTIPATARRCRRCSPSARFPHYGTGSYRRQTHCWMSFLASRASSTSSTDTAPSFRWRSSATSWECRITIGSTSSSSVSLPRPAWISGCPGRNTGACSAGSPASTFGWTTHLDKLRGAPGDDLMSQLIRKAESGSPETYLDRVELRAVAGLVLAAGFETTVNLLGNGIRMLLDNPEHLRTLSQRPELWPNAVEEILRLESPVQLTARIALNDTEIAGDSGQIKANWWWCTSPRPTGIRPCSPTRTRSTSNETTPEDIWRSPAAGTSAWERLWLAPKVRWGCGRSSIASPTCGLPARAVAVTPGFCTVGRRCPWIWVRRGRWLRASGSTCRRSSTPASWCTPVRPVWLNMVPCASPRPPVPLGECCS